MIFFFALNSPPFAAKQPFRPAALAPSACFRLGPYLIVEQLSQLFRDQCKRLGSRNVFLVREQLRQLFYNEVSTGEHWGQMFYNNRRSTI